MKSTKKILIVEDEPTYLRILTTKLKQHGFWPMEATNGREGLAIAIQEKPDLILLDLKMPQMDGLEMAKALRQNDWGKTAKIIVLTNLADMEKVQQVVEMDVFQYLVKADIQIDELIEKIKKAVE